MTHCRRIRLLRGSANLAKVRGHTMAMAVDMTHVSLAAQDEWEAGIRADAESNYARRWEAIVRADERERNREAEGVELYLAMEHAEAVAARLVEVICEQEQIVGAYRAAVAALVVENNHGDAARIARGES